VLRRWRQPHSGHLGIGDALVEKQLRQLAPGLLRARMMSASCGLASAANSFAQELQKECPDIGARVFSSESLGSGTLTADEISAHINACDLMVQPYVDGISTRRTAAMAALANGRALLTTAAIPPNHSGSPATNWPWSRRAILTNS